MYLVGRNDGMVDPFFAAVTIERHVEHHVPRDLINRAIANYGAEWWWHLMEIPRHMPDQAALDKLPPFRGPEGVA